VCVGFWLVDVFESPKFQAHPVIGPLGPGRDASVKVTPSPLTTPEKSAARTAGSVIVTDLVTVEDPSLPVPVIVSLTEYVPATE
jgi:hypothetical protein